MKTVTVAGPSQVRVLDNEDARPGPGELVVEMKACGICGSDLEKVFGQYGQQSMRLGHEPAGVVADVGEPAADGPDGGARPVGFSRGDRVFTHHHVPCYSCHLCAHGQETMCPRYYETNLSPCGLSERYVVPAWNVSHGGVLKLSDSTTFAEAAMIEPLACCVRAWRKIDHRPGDSVAVYGVGPTGIMHVMLAAMRNSSSITCLDLNDYRLQFASDVMGEDPPSAVRTARSDDGSRRDVILGQSGGLGADVSIVATSSIQALADAIRMTRKGGTVMMFGVPSKGATMEADMADIYSREITLLTSYAASDRDTAEALGLIESGKIDVGRLVTHSYGLSDSQRAFEHARAGDGAMKIIITGD